MFAVEIKDAANNLANRVIEFCNHNQIEYHIKEKTEL